MTSGGRVGFVASTISSRDHWAGMGIWASLKSSEVMSSFSAACLRDLGMSPSDCDVALAGSCLGKAREREVEKGLERGRSIARRKAQPNRQPILGERWWYSIYYLLSSHSAIPLTPLFSIFCSPSKLNLENVTNSSFLPQMTLTISSGR